MSRRGRPLTIADYERLSGKKLKPQPQESRTGSRRTGVRSAQQRTVWHGAEAIDGGWKLIYQGKLPNMNKECPDWRKRWNLKQTCLRQFGILPFPATQFATVTITRVLGPREKQLDYENLVYAIKGAVDSLPNRRLKKRGQGYTGGGNYIVNDDPPHVNISYDQDVTRRQDGPMIEIRIIYEGPQP
jgi:hypothetical protein